MTLSEMSDYVCQKVGQTDVDSVAACKTFIDRRYQMIWDGALWRDALTLVSVTTTANDPWLLMPYGVERVLKVRVGDTTTVSPFDAGTVFDYDPSLFDNFGSSAGFMTFAPVVAYAGAAGDGLSLLATAASADAGLVGSVEWEDTSGNTLNVEIALGADAVIATTALLFLNRINKPSTSGLYSLYFSVGGNQFIAYTEYSAKRKARIKLLQGPSTATACLILGKKECPGFTVISNFAVSHASDDSASPGLRNIDNALISYAQGDMLERQRQYSKAAAKFQEGQSQLQIALDLEKNQSAQESRIIPADIHGSGFGTDDSFGASGKGFW